MSCESQFRPRRDHQLKKLIMKAERFILPSTNITMCTARLLLFYRTEKVNTVSRTYITTYNAHDCREMYIYPVTKKQEIQRVNLQDKIEKLAKKALRFIVTSTNTTMCTTRLLALFQTKKEDHNFAYLYCKIQLS